MIRNGIYSTNTRKERPVARILAIVFGCIAALLVLFILVSAARYGGEDATYIPQAREISDLKIQVEEQTQTIDALRAEIVDLKAQLVAEQEKNAALIQPEPVEEEDAETTEE